MDIRGLGGSGCWGIVSLGKGVCGGHCEFRKERGGAIEGGSSCRYSLFVAVVLQAAIECSLRARNRLRVKVTMDGCRGVGQERPTSENHKSEIDFGNPGRAGELESLLCCREWWPSLVRSVAAQCTETGHFIFSDTWRPTKALGEAARPAHCAHYAEIRGPGSLSL